MHGHLPLNFVAVEARSCFQRCVGSGKISGGQQVDLSLSYEIERHFRRTDDGWHGCRSFPMTEVDGGGLRLHLTFDGSDHAHFDKVWHLTYDLYPVGHDDDLGD